MAAVKLGPWGYGLVQPFNHSGYDGIKSIVLYHGFIVDSMEVEYVKDGKSVSVAKVGGNGGGRTKIILDYPSEYLVKIEGKAGPYDVAGGVPSIKEMMLYSNRRAFGPFGSGAFETTASKWRDLDCSTNGEKIVGFHGHADPHGYIASIGIYVKP